MSKAYRKKLDHMRALTLLEQTLERTVRRQQTRHFLEAFLTPNERDTLAQRLRVAGFLLAGHSYRGVSDQTGAAFRTIAAVDRYLKLADPQYRRVFPIRHRRKRTRPRRPISMDRPLPGSIKDFTRSVFGTSLL